VIIENVNRLGGYQLTLQYDPNIVSVINVSQGDFLGSTGRPVTPLGPNIGNSSLTIGAFTFGDADGPTGTGTLCNIIFEVKSQKAGTLGLINIMLSDTEANSIDVNQIGNATLTNEGNIAPVADAGPDQAVDEGDLVKLNGSNSLDTDGTITSYQWTQIKGTPVTLSDSASAQPDFTAPEVGSDGDELTFQLSVTDNDGLQSTDECSVTIKNDSDDGDGSSCFIRAVLKDS